MKRQGLALSTSRLLCAVASLGLLSCSSTPSAPPDPEGWRPLFDGRTLEGWTKTDFWNPGEVKAENEQLIIEPGQPMTGVTWAGDPPFRIDYEISLEAMRVKGSDFFVGLTFPVEASCASLILGGWGGGLCGISSFDDFDASENETSSMREFENGRWYHVRLRVARGRIQVWLDEERIIDVETTGRKISTRFEITPCEPLGLATFDTTAAIRSFRWRPIPAPDETASADVQAPRS